MKAPDRHGGTRAIVVSVALVAVALAAVALAAVAPGPQRATAEKQSAATLQAALEDVREDTGAPGVSAAVVDDGELVWAGVAGARNADGDPVGPTTRFITASAGKTVTAALVLRLADAGELALGDRVSEHVSGLRGARGIRIRHLLEHASGLPDYLSSNEIWRTIESEPAHAWTRDEVLAVVGKPRFRPGSRVRYSNTNYIALGAVIESVTGGSVTDAFRRFAATPLGLLDSSWDYDASLYRDGARPYLERRDGGLAEGWNHGFVSTDFVGEVWTDGGLATTGTDLARFANELVTGTMLSPGGRRALLRFRERGFGRGVFRYRFDGRRIIGHDGVYEGFSAQHWTDPRSGVTIAVLANLQSRRGDASWVIWKRLARIALGGR